MRHDVLADVLSVMKNMKDRGSYEIEIRPISNTVKDVFEVLKAEGYILEFEIIEDKRGNYAKVKLTNLINNIGAIKPRFSITLAEFEKFEARYLPAKDFGRLIVSTSKGVMTHLQAKVKGLGGVLLAYVY
jgi:small subunit ribosomal protein S8